MNPSASTLALEIRKEGLPDTEETMLQNAFAPFFIEAEKLKEEAQSIVVTSADDKETIAKAREMRLKLKAIRTSTENSRKKLKDESLRRGRAIDGVANVIKFVIVPLEEHLQAQEDFAAIAMKKAVDAVKQKRVEELAQYGVDAAAYANLGEMPLDIYTNLLAGAKHAFDLKKEAEAKAEEDRKRREKEEAAERERIRIENEKLKKQAAIDAKKREEEQKKREAAEAELRKQREAAEKIEKERKAEEARKVREAKKLAAAPDKKKIQVFADQLDELEIPMMSSEEGMKVMRGFTTLIKKTITYLRDEAAAL